MDDDQITHSIALERGRGMVKEVDIVIAASGSAQAVGLTNLIKCLLVK
jgi:hypothetical protein